MKIETLAFGIVLFALMSCGGNDVKETDKKEPEIKELRKDDDIHPDEDAREQVSEQEEVTIPSFEVEVALSDMANAKLLESKETIIVDVAFSGSLKPNSKMKVSEDGQFYLANASREIKPGQTARFDGIVIPKNMLEALKNKDYEVGVNVYTGRKVFPNNLLSSLGAFGKISEFKNQKITIDAKLIQGE